MRTSYVARVTQSKYVDHFARVARRGATLETISSYGALTCSGREYRRSKHFFVNRVINKFVELTPDKMLEWQRKILVSHRVLIYFI